MDAYTESEIQRVQKLISDMGPPESWNPRFAKSRHLRVKVYEAYIQRLLMPK